MLDLLSIREIKPIKDDIRCVTCLKFKSIVHASDIWELVDDNFVRMEMPSVNSCFLIDNICKGHTFRVDDYDVINACDAYELCNEWLGINKTFINVVNGIIDYLFLTDSGMFDKVAIMEIAKTLSQKTVAVVDGEMEKKNKDIKIQFQVEVLNYGVIEEVRRRLNDA